MNALVRAVARACLPCLLLLAGPARAGDAPAPALTASQVQAGFQARQAERSRLEAERQRLARDYAAERAHCMQRFQVFACLDEAAGRHRRLDGVLAERQRRLDLLDREQRAEQERERVRANLVAHAQDQARRAASQREQARRAQASAPAPAKARPAARPVQPGRASTPPQPLQSASQARQARRESLQREQSYQSLRERAGAQQGSPAPALPVPPASGPLQFPR